MLNWKWIVEPSDRSKNAMPDEAIYRITLLCEWYWQHSAVYKKVFSVSAELCTKKWVCFELIFTVWTMISKTDYCSVLNYRSCFINVAVCSF